MQHVAIERERVQTHERVRVQTHIRVSGYHRSSACARFNTEVHDQALKEHTDIPWQRGTRKASNNMHVLSGFSSSAAEAESVQVTCNGCVLIH